MVGFGEINAVDVFLKEYQICFAQRFGLMYDHPQGTEVSYYLKYNTKK